MARKKIGTIGVDSGLCWIGDPCYILHKKQLSKDLGKDWHGFCDNIYEHDTKEFRDGVVSSTGYGDGSYPVYATLGHEGRVMKLEVIFDGSEDEDDD